MTGPEPEPAPERAPLPLRVACLVAGAEGVVLVVYAVIVVLDLTGDRVAMGLTSSGFLALYGGFLVFASARLLRLDDWSRAPVVMAQLIQALVGFSFWGGDTVPVAIALIAAAIVALGGVFHPRSLAAMADAD